MSRRSRRLAGLPPVSAEDETSSSDEKVLYKTESLRENGLLNTDYTRIEIAWLSVIILFILIPFYLFLASS